MSHLTQYPKPKSTESDNCFFPIFPFHPITWNYLVSIILLRLHSLVNGVMHNLYKNCHPFLHHNNCNIKAPPFILRRATWSQASTCFQGNKEKLNSSLFLIYKWKLSKWWIYICSVFTICQKLTIVPSRINKIKYISNSESILEWIISTKHYKFWDKFPSTAFTLCREYII